MISSAPSLTIAFLAGLISFLSPCVLPLVPSYLGVIGGRAPLPRALGFILGFALVFVALGATASSLGALLDVYRFTLARVAGVLIIFFGLVMLGVIRLPFMMRDTRELSSADQYGPVALGAAFAFGWSPCLGPVLGSILGLAASTQSLSQGVGLLLIYSLGLAVPFLLSALLWERLNLRRLNKYAGVFEKIGGAILIALGALMVTGRFALLASWAFSIMPEWLRL
ncbi:cytochrome c biogenesis CcdA family protein [Deinococcus sp.]|uniref:cytochrome c biogenesis CcdA family protein n=1 Tax=Deinococcus sp. TaxID=47478 RepID=UPI003B59C912